MQIQKALISFATFYARWIIMQFAIAKMCEYNIQLVNTPYSFNSFPSSLLLNLCNYVIKHSFLFCPCSSLILGIHIDTSVWQDGFYGDSGMGGFCPKCNMVFPSLVIRFLSVSPFNCVFVAVGTKRSVPLTKVGEKFMLRSNASNK